MGGVSTRDVWNDPTCVQFSKNLTNQVLNRAALYEAFLFPADN